MNREELRTTEKLLLEISEYFCEGQGYINVETEEFNKCGIRLIYFIACLNPENPGYGRAAGAFVYGHRVYKFQYNIHTPTSKGPWRSNQMDSIEHVILRDDVYIGPHIGFEPTVFGRRAFWFHTPMSSLDEEEKALRTLMRSLQAYVRRQGWLKRLRSLDSAHERWELERSTKGREERTEDIRKTCAQGTALERKEI